MGERPGAFLALGAIILAVEHAGVAQILVGALEAGGHLGVAQIVERLR